MQNRLTSVGILCLLVTAGLVGFITFESEVVNAPGIIIYVDDDYTVEDPTHKKTIQAGVNAANLGDTVFVYSGTYYERVTVNKTINLTGEDKEKTIIDGGGGAGGGYVVRIEVDWVNISGFTVTNAGTQLGDHGINIESNNNTVFGNKVSNNYYGIYLCNSNGNTVTTNNVSSNNREGIHLINSSFNNIISNTLKFNPFEGIHVRFSIGNDITGNIVSYNEQGIVLHFSSRNTINNNTCYSNDLMGIYIWFSDRNNVNGNIVFSNYWGIYLFGSRWNNIENNNASNNYDGITLYSYSKENNVRGNTASSNSRNGIIIAVHSDENNITGNNVSNNENGIFLESGSSENNIRGNTISSNFWHGIYFLDLSWGNTSYNIIADNDITDNLEGITFFYSPYNYIITGNNVSNNGYGIRLWFSSNGNRIASNTISSNNIDGISLEASSYNNITSNFISNNLKGINIPSLSHNNNITVNNISSNGNGIVMDDSYRNTVIGNAFYLNSLYAIDIRNNGNNTIHHNNFIDNNGGSVQARDTIGTNHWNDSYPSGGNYWDDWTTPDTMSGENQDIPGSDGFVDFPYFLDGGMGARDYFPFSIPLEISPPVITNLQPPDASTTNDSTPIIGADYYDPSGIDVSSVVLVVDGIDVTLSTTVTASNVSYIPGVPLSESIHTVYLEVKDIFGNLATATWSFTVDTLPPVITNLQPPDASITSDPTPIISADYSDPSGINVSSVVLKVDGVDVTSSATVTASGVIYIPLTALSEGVHIVYIEVMDNIGNLAIATWSFSVDIVIYPPVNLTTKTVNNGNNVELEWEPPSSLSLDHYLIYRADSTTEFDFSTPYNSSLTWPDPINTTWVEPDSSVTVMDDDFYYIVRAANFDESDISLTSNTAGVWTKTFEPGVSTFSLPLEPFAKKDTEYLCQDMNASYIKWMNTTTHTWIRHDKGDSINNTLLKVGEGYEIGFLGKSIQTRYTFCGLPGAMIIYDDDILFSGFDPDSEAKNLTVSIDPNGNVTLIWEEPASMGPGDWYEVYYSNSRDGFFKTFGLDYDLACPPIGYGASTTTIAGLGAGDPGTRLYFMVVPFNSLGVRGASTYSVGVWTEEYLAGYDTFGIPLKMDYSQTADWYCDNIPDTVGINHYLSSENRWVWHSTVMPQDAYDPVLVMGEGYQISTSGATKYIFIGR